MSRFVLFVLLSLGFVLAHAATLTGDWRVLDEDDGTPSAIVTISEVGGNFLGHIKRVIASPGEDPDPRCTACKGERHNQRVNGMLILTGLTRQDDVWTGGEILDPDSGKTYRCRITMSADGKQLEVRAYLGLPTFGRTQKWVREAEQK